MLHSFLTSGGRPQTTLTNFVTNGNFVDTTGWSAYYATLTAASNILSVTGNGANADPRVYQGTSVPAISGKKIYYRTKAKVTNANCTSILIYLTDGANTVTGASVAVNNPIQNTVYTLSGVISVGAGLTGNIRVWVRNYYADAATANGKVMEVQEVIAIDLTAIFGAGLEPTAAQMTRWLDIFSAGWFNTTKAIPKRIF